MKGGHKDSEVKSFDAGLMLGGSLLLLSSCSMVWISRQFIYGEGHLERPVLLFVFLYLIGWAGYGLACFKSRLTNNSFQLLCILLIGFVLRVIFFYTNPILEADYYRYTFDGQVLLSGQNPYKLSPAQFDLKSLNIMSADANDAKRIWERISYPEVKTIYPPLAQFIFGVHALLFGWNELGFRLLFLVFDALTILILFLILKARGSPLTHIIFYVWNPLVLKEGLNSMHIDMACLPLLAGLCLAIQKRKYFMAMAGCFCAAWIKIIPLLLWPILFFHSKLNGELWNAKRTSGLFLFFSMILVGLMFIGADQPLSGLKTFQSEWVTNGSIYPLLLGLGLNLGLNGDLVQGLAKAIIVTVLCLAFFWIRNRVPKVEETIDYSMWVLLGIFLLSPVGNPWYLLWIVPFFSIRPNGVIFFCMMMLSLYYVEFHLYYRDQESMLWLLKLVEYIPIYGFIFWKLIKKLKS